MSVRTMSLVWELDLPDSEKLVLLALADCANDDGHCWPGMNALKRKCTKSDRTIQLAIKMLVVKGHLTRREVPGKGCNYTVHPIVRLDTPEAITPRSDNAPKGTTPTPEAASGKPSRTINSLSSDRARGWHRLPEGWRPTKPLPLQLQAKVDQWPPGALNDEIAAFKRWAANAEDKNGKGRKLDWDKALWNWLGRRHDERRTYRMAGHQSDGLSSTARAAVAVFGAPGTG